MTTDELRALYLKFFETRGHTVLPSDSLVPQDDPTVLFTPAGMNQFKDAFLGTSPLKLKRAATAQKCLRTSDIDEVGRTAYHHSFFEMLGNFSFGDYFKREAIEYAWEFLTQVLKISPERLRVSVYETDDEAFDIWAKAIGVRRDWICRFGEHENFWPADAPSQSPAGTLCGPDTEIFVDMGVQVGCGRPECSPACSCGRFVEVWNLVFQQFEKGAAKGELRRLPFNNVDTGMGLERTAAVLQGKMSDYENDVFAPLVAWVRHRFRLPAQVDAEVQRRMNRIADHTRAVVFCLADGVRPSNEGRGYVERRLLRRAALDGLRLGAQAPFLFELVPLVARVMRGGYPELASRVAGITETIRREEEGFLQVVDQRSPFIRRTCEGLVAKGAKTLPGDLAADWAQTHGVPVELTEAIAAEYGLGLDRPGFEAAMERHRELSRAASTMGESVFSEAIQKARAVQDHARAQGAEAATDFVGYRTLRAEGSVLSILDSHGRPIEAADAASGPIEIILDRTPFYAEAGGQSADTGRLMAPGFEFEVVGTKRGGALVWHSGTIKAGRVQVGQTLTAEVDPVRRAGLARSHTGTHLLQYALRAVLGDHVAQAGSRVENDTFTFDFSHPGALSDEEKREIERLANERIVEDEAVQTAEMSLEEARTTGALMFFGEKYGERVRLVSVGDYSKELCGGTHAHRIGEIGALKIIGEESVAAGVRRITALTGLAALRRAQEREALLADLSDLLRAPPEALPARVRSLLDEMKRLRREAERAVQRGAGNSADDLLAQAQAVGQAKVIARAVPDLNVQQLRQLADQLKRKAERVAAVLASVVDGKVQMVVLASAALVEAGFRADAIAREVAKVVDGSGGGRADMAQAGGKAPDRLDEALDLARRLLADAVGVRRDI
jgi:alanyl-tRNA synthetase